MTKCPCGSLNQFDACCGPFLSRDKTPQTPEALMRSRYTAYTMGNIDYIQSTMTGNAAKGFEPEQAAVWAKQSKWLGLFVINAPAPKNEKGVVEFVARFQYNNAIQFLHEISAFKLIDERWYYVDGKPGKIGRNDPCFCGSGNKFKKCCFV